jgi:hypothetical protein
VDGLDRRAVLELEDDTGRPVDRRALADDPRQLQVEPLIDERASAAREHGAVSVPRPHALQPPEEVPRVGCVAERAEVVGTKIPGRESRLHHRSKESTTRDVFGTEMSDCRLDFFARTARVKRSFFGFFGVPVATLVPILVGACTVPSDDESPVSGPAQAITLHVADGSTDPMDHLNVIGADAMEGRGTGSPGHQRAADYIVGEARRASLEPAYPDAANPYFQPFTVGSFATPPGVADEHEAHDFGLELFEHAVYLNGNASADTRGEMGKSLCGALERSGDACPPGVQDGTVDPRSLVEPALGVSTNNIVGLMTGSGPHKDEIIMLSAHLDHLGKSATALYPGADDNGSGSAALVAIMHTLAAIRQTQPFDRTLGFLWTSGEEKGLLGAAYFVDNTPPTVPLARIKLVVNMDMVGRWDDTRYSLGADDVPATQAAIALFNAANQELPTPFARMNRDIQQYNRRQDGYAFSRRGVPAMFLFEGLSNPQGGGDLTPVYHRPTDTLANLMADNGGSKIRHMSALLAGAVVKIANAPPAQ